MNKVWAVLWAVFGAFWVIASIGGAGPVSATGSMIAGFMVARNLSEFLGDAD